MAQVRKRAVLIAALLAMGLGAVPVTSDTASAEPTAPFAPAQSARAFGDSVGVNVRLTFLDTSYADFETIKARLLELGVRYVGDGLCPTCEYQIDRLQRLAAEGIRANLGVGTVAGGTASIDAGLQVIKSRLRSSAIAITTINEPDISGDPNWIANTRWFQRELYARVKGDPALRGLPVIGPALVHRASRPALGDLSAYLDRGNLHPYPGGTPPLDNIVDEFQLVSHVSGRKPVVATEIGYHSDMAFTGGNRPASEQAIATYMPRIVLEGFRGGIDKTYIYTLADLWSPSEAAARGFPPSENSFGLLRWDLSPKPAFYTLRNLLRAVDADSAPVGTPGGLRLSLQGAGPDVRTLLLRSADGTYALVLWRPASVWNWLNLTPVAPASDQLDVVLGQPVALAQRFDPVASSAETNRWTDPSRIGVELGAAPVVLRLTPPGVASAERRRAALRGRRARSRCGSQLGAKKARATRCCTKKGKRAAQGKRRRPGRPRAHRRARASWSGACVSLGRRR